MKKIISTILAVVMIASMSLVAFADGYLATVTLDSKTIEVAEGTQDVTLDIAFTLSEKATTSMLAIGFVLPDGVTIKGYDASQYGALLGEGQTLASDDDLASGLITLFEDGGSNFDVNTFVIPVTFTVETSEVKEYEIALDPENTILCDPDSVPLNDVETLPTATIKVKAPFLAETVEGAKVTSEVSEVTIDDAVYTNVAIFTATLGTGEGNYSEAGFIWVKDGNKTDNKYTVDAAVISGTGTFEYTAAMFAIENGVKIEAIPYYVTAE